MSIINHQETTAELFYWTPNAALFKPDKHPIDNYIVVERSTGGDLILNHLSVVGCLSVLEVNLTKNFLPKIITNVEGNFRTIVSVNGMCLQNTPAEAPEKELLGDHLYFVVESYHNLFPDE